MVAGKDGSPLVIVSGARTPMAEYSGTKGYGRLKDVSAIDLAVVAAKAAMARGKVDPKDIDQCFVGNATQSSNDALYGARHVLLKAGVPETVPGLTVNRICGSGLQAVVSGAEQIQLGRAKTALCGGMENMSQVPFVVRGAREGFRLGQNMVGEDLLFAALMDPYCGFFMAQTAENVAKDYGIGRLEQDAYALRSHQLGAAAVKSGAFAEEIVPVEVRRGDKVVDTVTTDDHIKPDTTLEGLSALRPAFGKDGTVTAGNASGIVDGAAAVVISTRAQADAKGWPVLAEIVDWEIAGVPPRIMGIGPVPAIEGVAKRAGIRVADIDLVEINEAFSAQYLGCEKLLKLDRARCNVNGGAIALGHPLGATGTRILYSVARELKARGGRYAVASACIGGGQGIAVLVRNAK
jgi:acetyl-CoA acyltransferase 2